MTNECATCGHTLHRLETSRPYLWCPRCGTLREATGDFIRDEAPKLVERVRQLHATLEANHRAAHRPDLWRRLGLHEAAWPPGERPLGWREAPEDLDTTREPGT